MALKGLITGVSGFVGHHLARLLIDHGWQISGTDLVKTDLDIPFYQCDLIDKEFLTKVVVRTSPDVIFHLGGLLKSQNPNRLINVHVLGTLTLLESIQATGLRPLIIVASSSSVYGGGLEKVQISETQQPNPITLYGLSKLFQEMTVTHYQKMNEMKVNLVRMFNLVGPRLSGEMSLSAFAKQIAYSERLDQPGHILTGNLDSVRDFVDVRDAAHAYLLIAEQGRVGETYNVCSGQPIRVGECLTHMINRSRMVIEIDEDPALMQTKDIPFQIGNPMKLLDDTGWQASIPLTQSLDDLLDYWRNVINSVQE